MTPLDIKRHFGSQYRFHIQTGMSSGTLGNWLKSGVVPYASQLVVQAHTNGVLKADEKSVESVVEAPCYPNARELRRSFTLEQVDFMCYQLKQWHENCRDLMRKGELNTRKLGDAKRALFSALCGE